MHKPLFITLGLVFVGLAVLVIFLPVLPTTTLLLLALACFARSSEKFHKWLSTNRTFGLFIKQRHQTRSMSRKAKACALITICVGSGISILTVDTLPMKLIVAGGSSFLL